MSSPPASHLLTFLLPKAAAAVPIPPGGWPFGCVVEFGRVGLVSLMGPSREAVMLVGAELLRVACQHLPALSIAARLYTLPPAARGDGRDWLHVSSGYGGVDTWSIIVGAEVAFSPTSLDPYIPELEGRAQPALAIVSNDR